MADFIVEDIKEQIVKQPLEDEQAFGNWLAGFIDGEGCFSILKRTRTDGYDSGYYCRFSLGIRDDDSAVIHEIIKRTLIGSSIHRRKTAGENLIVWEVNSKKNCVDLVRFLTKYPLRAKKRRDFNIWQEAVVEWVKVKPIYHKLENGRFSRRSPVDWTNIAKLKQELTDIKRYNS